MSRIVADLGNSRLKWGRIGPDGRLIETIALPLDDPGAWEQALGAWGGQARRSDWAISTVNPPVAARLGMFLEEQSASVRWFRSASEVPVRHDLEHPETAGADRAWAVRAALDLSGGTGPGLVILCGTALTVERLASDGTWQGGAIAPGLLTAARALHESTAQLPLVEPGEAPAAWGRSTLPALAAGAFWGTVGAACELRNRQAEGLEPPPWIILTGGDAERLAPWIEGDRARIVPDLVLMGLARGGFDGESRS
jgi:type III pantothenate kinase